MKIAMILVFLSACLTGFGQPLTNSTIETELSKMSSNVVSRLEIFYYPEDILRESAMTKEHLETKYWAKADIRDFYRSNFKSKFLSSVALSHLQERNGSRRDVRWGCILFDSNDNRVVSMYFDQFGDGEINGIQFSSNGKCLDLLRQTFAFR